MNWRGSVRSEFCWWLYGEHVVSIQVGWFICFLVNESSVVHASWQNAFGPLILDCLRPRWFIQLIQVLTVWCNKALL